MTMAQETLIMFDPERCNQCHGCEVACKIWRGPGTGVFFRRVFPVWHGQAREQKLRSMSLSCLHCVDPDCVDACPVDALAKEPETGRVLVDESVCIGCGACQQACVYGVPQITAEEIIQKCDLCIDQPFAMSQISPPCVSTCPGKALELVMVSREEKRQYEQWCREMIAQLQSL